MTEMEADAIIERALPMTNAAWRSKRPADMTRLELFEAIKDTRKAMLSAETWYESEEADHEDRAYAYESMMRSRMKLAELMKAQTAERFDVV